MEQNTAVLFILVGFVALVVTKRLLTNKHSLNDIRGPPRSSWLFGTRLLSWLYLPYLNAAYISGNIKDFFYQDNVGDMDFKFLQEYGAVWRMFQPFGVSDMVVNQREFLADGLVRPTCLFWPILR